MDPNQLADILSAPLTSGQTLKSTAFDHAVDRQSNLLEGLQLEQRRAAALHGPDSKRAQRLQAYVAIRQQALTEARTTASRAQAPAPIPNPQEFIIYGFVYGQSGAPVGDIDVSATDQNGAIVQSAASDATGYYALHVGAARSSQAPPKSSHREGIIHEAMEVAEKIEKVVEEDVCNQHKTPPPPPATLHLVASDRKRTFQIQSAETFQYEPGKLAYLDLTVPVQSATDSPR
ncbi:MAG: carboxypeptidase-like regulatory domain-containing protein [Terriglobia bacterium]